MASAKLALRDLATALRKFGDRYHAVDVFADDVKEVRDLVGGVLPPGVHPLDAEGRRFSVQVEAQTYLLELHRSEGVARFGRIPAPAVPASSASVAAGALLGGAAGAAIVAAASKKGDDWPIGLLLGLLVGGALGAAADSGGAIPPPPRHVFTLQFDPGTGEWMAYDGGLVRWMKSALAGAS